MPGVFSGFTIAPIIEISSGRPFNVLTGTDTNFDFDPLTDRRMRLRRECDDELRQCASETPSTRRRGRSICRVMPMLRRRRGRIAATSMGRWGGMRGSKPYVVFTDFRLARAFQFEHHMALQVTADAFN